MPIDQRLDRHAGCLLGLAAGDALGTAVEFRPRGTFEPVVDITGGGPFKLQPGQWTDDTSMALCLAESLIERQAFDAADLMQRFVRWWRNGHRSSTGVCFDIGTTTVRALRHFERTGEPNAGASDPDTAGNGSLMRLAPIAMFYSNDPVQAVLRAGDSSRTTHGAREAVDACRYFAGLLTGALNGEAKGPLVADLYAPAGVDWAATPLAPGVHEVAAGSFRQQGASRIRASGYVVHTLEAALWAFHHSSSFEEGALLAVNLGEDADTTGAVYGQLAGAYYGRRGIPQRWLATVHGALEIEQLAARLAMRSTERSN